MERIKQFLHGLSQSHRSHHVAGGFLLGLVFGFGAAVCVAGALEFKDVQHDPRNAKRTFRGLTWRAWDGIDLGLTVAGGLLGSLVRWWVIGRFM